MKWFLFVCFCTGLLSFDNSVFAETKIVFNTMESVPFQGENLENQGFLVEISKEAFGRVGYGLEVRFVPWERALGEAESGQVDGVLGAWYNEERAKSFEYTDAIGKSTLIFLKRKEQKIEYETLKDLKEYKIGVVGGYTYTDAFDKAAFLDKEAVHSTELNLRKLLYKRIDLTPDIEEVVNYLIRSKLPEHAGSIESVGKPLKVHLIFNIVSRANPNFKKIAGDFNKGLRMMKESGIYDEILIRNGVSR